MSWSQMAVGFGALAIAGQTLISAALPDPAFMTVTRLEYSAGQVEYARRVNRDMVADWSVTVVHGGDDVCHGGGSAAYTQSEPETQPMPLDVFVGADCELAPGREYTLFAHWVPRDGSVTVSSSVTFTED